MIFVLLLGSCAAAVAAAGAEDPDPCAGAKRTYGWCEAENAGYVASVRIPSKMLYEALDAHGHDIDPASVTCAACREAIREDGFCPAHRMGFVRGEAYLTPLTYRIARARPIDPGTIACPVCRSHTRDIGWCETHRVGIAGAIAIDDRAAFEEFRAARAILLKAVDRAARCETCAAAMVADGYCAEHRITYKDGEPAPPAR